MFIPELTVGLCRIDLDTLEKYRAVDMLSRPPTGSEFAEILTFQITDESSTFLTPKGSHFYKT